MDSSLEKVTVIDSNIIAGAIMNEIADVEKIERMYTTELSSVDLFKIDCAILNSLRNTEDFSRDLLKQLETGKFEEIIQKPPKSKDILQEIQQETIMDITLPLNKMFDEMAGFVSEALIS